MFNSLIINNNFDTYMLTYIKLQPLFLVGLDIIKLGVTIVQCWVCWVVIPRNFSLIPSVGKSFLNFRLSPTSYKAIQTSQWNPLHILLFYFAVRSQLNSRCHVPWLNLCARAHTTGMCIKVYRTIFGLQTNEEEEEEIIMSCWNV